MHKNRVGQNRIYTPYDRIFDDFPAKNTVYTPYIYGSGQPYTRSTTDSPLVHRLRFYVPSSNYVIQI